MEQQSDGGMSAEGKKRRGRGPTKPFPVLSFEETLSLAKSILDHGVNGEIQRLTLLSRLNWSPSSSRTRNLITNSTKYGLTAGSYSASSLTVTDNGHVVLGVDHSPQEVLSKKLELAIKQFDPFDRLYEKLKGHRLPEQVVLQDQLENLGINNADREIAASIFAANIRYLELVEEISGQNYVKSIEQIYEQPLSDSSSETPSDREPDDDASTVGETPSKTAQESNTVRSPSLHIDLQIHIDSSATPEQIDHIFESMGRYLYGRKG